MKAYLIAYISAGVVFLGMDIVWLSKMSGTFYRPALGDILLDKPNLAPAAIFYFIYMAGIVFFAISPALNSGRWATALMNGAFFGFVAYATYDLTNQATLKNWPVAITIADLCWGIFVTATSALAGYIAAKSMLKIF